MILLAGAIPVAELPLTLAKVSVEGEGILVNGHRLDIDRGTATLLTVVWTACRELGVDGPTALVAGDLGTRQGSVAIYDYLAEHLPNMDDVSVVTFHYIMPDMKKNKKVLEAVNAMKKRPILIADAGSMYVAKAGGDASAYDVFTPDLGETAYLADEEAPHPTYTRGFIFHMEDNVPELIRMAYAAKNAAHTMFIKGATDYIVHEGEILEVISEPNIEELEPIGGTGDNITALITALIYAGKSPVEACSIAGRVNRRAGELSRPTPATQIRDIIKCIPQALREVLAEKG